MPLRSPAGKDKQTHPHDASLGMKGTLGLTYSLHCHSGTHTLLRHRSCGLSWIVHLCDDRTVRRRWDARYRLPSVASSRS